MTQNQGTTAPQSSVVTETTFGTVTRAPGRTTITADGDTLRDWARRGDFSWPCSQLARLDGVTVVFDSVGRPNRPLGKRRSAPTSACDELDAWSSEVLVRAGYPNHPAIRS